MWVLLTLVSGKLLVLSWRWRGCMSSAVISGIIALVSHYLGLMSFFWRLFASLLRLSSFFSILCASMHGLFKRCVRLKGVDAIVGLWKVVNFGFKYLHLRSLCSVWVQMLAGWIEAALCGSAR